MSILENVNWKQIAIDTVWVVAVTFVGGFILGWAFLMTNVQDTPAAALAEIYQSFLLVFLTSLVIFLFRKRSNSHAFLFVLALWLTGFPDVFYGLPVVQWFLSIIWVFGLVFSAKLISHGLRLIRGKLSSTT